MIDIFQSRRDYNEPCKWWSRDENDDNEANALIMKRVPTGIFMAKEVGAEQLRNQVIFDSFMFGQGSVTIKSPDNLTGIKANDLVEYQDEKWLVINVQKIKAKKQNSYYAKDTNCSHYWFLELRK